MTLVQLDILPMIFAILTQVLMAVLTHALVGVLMLIRVELSTAMNMGMSNEAMITVLRVQVLMNALTECPPKTGVLVAYRQKICVICI